MAGTSFDLGAFEAPDNKERVFLTPGFRKMTIREFLYEKEDEGKTPLILMKMFKTNEDGSETDFTEKLYLSGKLNKQGTMSAIVRLFELNRGITGDKKMNLEAENYTYSKTESNGTSEEYTIPNPQAVCDFLNKKCAGKTAIWRVGGEENEDGKVFTKLDYSGFLYYVDKDKNLCTYKNERDFTKSEHSYSVRKKKTDAPAHSGSMADVSKLDDL